MSNQSKTLQQSKIRKFSFFPLGSQALCLQVASFLVPLPTICQNLILENTGFAKTRLQTSGMSTPVSSMSTDMATLGHSSVLNCLSISCALWSSDTMMRASFPLYWGYSFSNASQSRLACCLVIAKKIVLAGSVPVESMMQLSMNSLTIASLVPMTATFFSMSVPSKFTSSGSTPFSSSSLITL